MALITGNISVTPKTVEDIFLFAQKAEPMRVFQSSYTCPTLPNNASHSTPNENANSMNVFSYWVLITYQAFYEAHEIST